MSDPIYVIGHRNPDADSICAALAYADFKNQLSNSQDYIAVRCGNSNARIDVILDNFKTSLPIFMGDLTPRLKDVMVTKIQTAENSSTCVDALESMDKFDVRALPVLNDDDTIKGYISIFQMGEFFIPKISNPIAMRRVVTSVDAIVKSLNATVLTSSDSSKTNEMYVRVGAMDIRSFGNFSGDEKTNAGNSIIVVGDRYDIQQKSIYSGVKLLVITGGLDVEPEVIELAKEKGVNLIVSPFDSATTAWTIRSASFIDDMVETKCYRFRSDDTIRDVRKRTAMINAPLYFVTDKTEKLLGVFSKTDLLKPNKTKVILVDHNEVGQAIQGAKDVNILEIIDHHRLGNTPTSQPILFINEPVGSTCTIVADQYRRYNLKPSATMAGIMMSGIISDTLHLNSPTSTEKDENTLDWLSSISKVDSSELSKIIFNAGSIIVSSSPKEVITSDQKFYDEGELRYSVSQVEELGMANFWEKKDALLLAIQAFRDKHDLYSAFLLVTDINTQNSLLLVSGEHEMIDRISYPMIEDKSIFDLPGIVSRKKQLIPYLTRVLNPEN